MLLLQALLSCMIVTPSQRAYISLLHPTNTLSLSHTHTHTTHTHTHIHTQQIAEVQSELAQAREAASTLSTVKLGGGWGGCGNPPPNPPPRDKLLQNVYTDEYLLNRDATSCCRGLKHFGAYSIVMAAPPPPSLPDTQVALEQVFISMYISQQRFASLMSKYP